MVNRIKDGREKAVPAFSVSLKRSISDEFILICANMNKKVSEIIRDFVLDFIGENKEKYG